MRRRPPRSTRTDTLFPYTTLFRSKAKIKIALNYLEEEGFAGWAKQKIKERLFELDLVAVDPDMIASEVIPARADAIHIDWFFNEPKEYTNEADFHHSCSSDGQARSEDRRVGTRCVCTCRSWWSR